MKRIRLTIIVCIVLAMLAAMSACATPTVTPTTAAMPTATPVPLEHRSITFYTVAGYYSTALKEAAAAYTVLHPETEVKIEAVGGNENYKTVVDTKMAAGGQDAPDIVHTNLLGDMTEYINKGWLLKLNDFVNEPNQYNGGVTVFKGIDPAYEGYCYDKNGNIGMLPFDLVGTAFYYNKDIFDKVGLTAPTSWEDLFADCDKLKAAGYIPISNGAGGGGTEGWLYWAFVDWAEQSIYPSLFVLPGDARYLDSMKVDTTAKYDPNNGSWDFGTTMDTEKIINAIQNKTFDRQGAVEKKMWTTLKTLASYYEDGSFTVDGPTTYNLFLSQKAAIYLNGSWQIGTLLADQKKLGDKSFKWGTFKFPGFKTADPLFPGQPRGILVPGHWLGILDKKDAVQAARAEDFMKYLYSKDVAQKVIQRTLEVGEFVQGPSLVLGVTLPAEVNAYLEGFKVNGNMKTDIAALSEAYIPDSLPAWNQNQLNFYQGKITIDEFLKNKMVFSDAAIAKTIADNKFDLNPATNP